MAPHSSTLAWKIPWMEEPGRLQSMGSLSRTRLSIFTFTHWRRKWQPNPVFLPGESQEQGSLVGCYLWGCTESDTTEVIQQQQVYSSLLKTSKGPLFLSPSDVSQKLPGSSPSGSRVIRRGDGVDVLGKNLFNYRYIERLETDSVVGKLVEKRRLNNLVYVEYQSPPTQATGVFPFSRRRGGTEASLVQSQKPGKISRLGEYPHTQQEFSQKNREQERMTWGNQSFQKLIPFLYFWICLYTFCYIQGSIQSHAGVSSPDLYQNQVLHIKRSQGFYIIFWP